MYYKFINFISVLFNFLNERFPFFDHKNPIGYLFAFALQYVTVICTVHIAICNTGIITGSCCMLISLTRDIEHSLRRIRKNKKPPNCLDQFSEFVQFHANAIQLSDELSKCISTIKKHKLRFSAIFE